MFGRCELFDASGERCRGAALSRCVEDKTVYCLAHRGFRRGIPAEDRCAACEGAAPDARREARAIAADQDVAAVRIMSDPAVLADLVRARGVQTHVGVVTRVAAGGGWLRGRRTEAEETRFWLIDLETDPDDPTRDVGLGLTTQGAWVRHVRPAGSGLPPTLLTGVFPTTEGARELVRWFHRHNVDLPA
jgi:hypothetical protein